MPGTRISKAILSVLMACFLFSLMFLVPKLVSGAPSWQEVVFMRFASAFTVICLYLICRYPRQEWRKTVASNTPWMHVARACFGVGAVGAIVYASSHMNFADVMSISFTKGGFLLLFGYLFLGEAVGWYRSLAILFSFAGAFVIITTQSGAPSAELLGGPAAIALLAAAFIAAEIIFIKRASISDRLMPMLFLVNGSGTVIGGLLCLVNGFSISLGQVAFLALMGPLAFLGQSLNFIGHSHADATFLGPFAYVTIFYSSLLGWLVLRQELGFGMIAGAVLLVISGLLVSRTPANTISKDRLAVLKG